MRVKLVYTQYNISNSQALSWCFVLIFLWDSKPGFVLGLFLHFFQSQGFCSYKIALVLKKSVTSYFNQFSLIYLLVDQAWIDIFLSSDRMSNRNNVTSCKVNIRAPTRQISFFLQKHRDIRRFMYFSKST